ncbi:hypothetical protein [Longibacter salinarum]|uniref:hypothetical protein n=1 Tax=Longibacter salinarum TaxID=1850348 RepID=UPI00117D5D32|nr:hypothetical protein [Longibacter salinarum]
MQDFEIQPDLQVPSSLTIIILESGQGATEFTVQYQGFDEHPSLSSSNTDLTLDRLEQTGDPSAGEQTWRATFNKVPDTILDETLTLSASAGGQDITRSISVLVAEIDITTSFASSYASVIDYEDGIRSVSTTGGTTTEVVEEASANSNGDQSLRVETTAGGAVTVDREANGPGTDRFSFLVLPDPSTTFTLEIAITEGVSSGEETRTLSIPITSGSTWRRYAIEYDKFDGGLNPVTNAAGGDGAFKSVTFTSDGPATYHLDEISLADESSNMVEIHNFESTTNAYGSGSDIAFSNSNNVAAEADGPTSRSLSYSGGGNFFGYNYDPIKVDVTESDFLSLRVGEVSRDFDLYVFVQTYDSEGGYTYDAGTIRSISAGMEWRQIDIPLGDLGTSASALKNPGINNVGFEVRRKATDTTSESIDFLLDDIRFRPAN